MSMHQTIRPTLRVMTIQDALSWAFSTEKAALDFDQYGAHEFDRVGVDPIWRGIQMQALGVAVDGGGSSDPAHDAQIIAAAVEALPIGHGGRKMAIQVADLARARSAPDWGQGDRLACIPEGWDWDDTLGEFLAGSRKDGSVWAWRCKRRKSHERRGDWCPVSYTGTARIIAAKRRNYLLWWGALLYLLGELQRPGLLSSIELSGGMPDMAPWKVEGC